MSSGKVSNVAILTQENKIWSAKKKQKKAQVKEVLFDEDARREFLTGFRKRKLARQEAGKAKALERERQSRLEARREQRKELAERAAQNAKAVERAYAGGSDSDESQASGSSPRKADPEEMEFENEEQVATVTIVEDFEASDLKMLSNGSAPPKAPSSKPDHQSSQKSTKSKLAKAKKPVNPKPKFRYETKAAKKHEKIKQKARREEKGNRNNRHKSRR